MTTTLPLVVWPLPLLLLLLLLAVGCRMSAGSKPAAPEQAAATTTNGPWLTPVLLHGIELPGHRYALQHRHTNHNNNNDNHHHHPSNNNKNNNSNSSPSILLHRHGHGVRSLRLYGWNMNMYVASLYSSSQPTTIQHHHHHDHESLPSSSSTVQFHFVFLRAVSQSQVRLAWQKQLDWSVDPIHAAYDHYHDDVQTFVSMFGAMPQHGEVTIQFENHHHNNHDAKTHIWDQGTFRGTIPGPHFSRAFWSMWFGGNCVQHDLQDALLGNFTNAEHHRGTAVEVLV